LKFVIELLEGKVGWEKISLDVKRKTRRQGELYFLTQNGRRRACR